MTNKRGIENRMKILRFIEKYRKDNGYAPSYQEIAEGTGASKNTVYHHIGQMEKDGLVSRGWGIARSFLLTEKGRALVDGHQ